MKKLYLCIDKNGKVDLIKYDKPTKEFSDNFAKVLEVDESDIPNEEKLGHSKELMFDSETNKLWYNFVPHTEQDAVISQLYTYTEQLLDENNRIMKYNEMLTKKIEDLQGEQASESRMLKMALAEVYEEIE